MDFASLELRVATAFASKDCHTELAAEMFNCAPEQVTKAQRKQAKAVNFYRAYSFTGKPASPKEDYMDPLFSRLDRRIDRAAQTGRKLSRVLVHPDDMRELMKPTTTHPDLDGLEYKGLPLQSLRAAVYEKNQRETQASI